MRGALNISKQPAYLMPRRDIDIEMSGASIPDDLEHLAGLAPGDMGGEIVKKHNHEAPVLDRAVDSLVDLRQE